MVSSQHLSVLGYIPTKALIYTSYTFRLQMAEKQRDGGSLHKCRHSACAACGAAAAATSNFWAACIPCAAATAQHGELRVVEGRPIVLRLLLPRLLLVLLPVALPLPLLPLRLPA